MTNGKKTNSLDRLTKSDWYDIINESIQKVLCEAGGTLTSRVLASRSAPRRSFNAEEMLKQALSCDTLADVYKDRNLSQMLRYHKMSDGRSYLDYVKEQFAKDGKYKTNKRGTNRIKRIKWTPETAIAYSSEFINGYDLCETPKGRSCYHFLKTRDLLDKAFKKARAADAEKANKMIIDNEVAYQKEKERRLALAAQRKADMEARKKQRAIDKENERKQAFLDKQLMRDNKIQEILKYIKQNGIKRRADLKRDNPQYFNILSNIPNMLNSLFGDKEQSRSVHDIERLNMSLAKSDSPSHFKRYSPFSYKRMMNNGTLKQYYPGWQQINGKWTKTDF